MNWRIVSTQRISGIPCLVAAVLSTTWVMADSAEDWAKMKAIRPRGYVCYRAEQPLRIDGRLDEKAWQNAPWTEAFVDIEGDRKPKPRLQTRAKMLWDDEYFYIAAELEEPHVWGTLTKHDSVIFHDNDFELFIDPDGDNHEYYEFEMNALNTGWDLFLPRPYKDGGQADDGWQISGLKTAVHVDGTLNDPSDSDRGWSVEIAVPWSALREFAHRAAPPQDGDHWRVNFSRVEWQHQIIDGKYHKVPKTAEDNWVWSPQGIIDMHRPERWGDVQFSTSAPGSTEYREEAGQSAQQVLLEIYHHQKAFEQKHKRWGTRLDELNLDPNLGKELSAPELKITPTGYRASVSTAGPSVEKWTIRHDSRLRRATAFDDLVDDLEGVLAAQVTAWNAGNIDEFMEHYWKSNDLSFSSGGKTTRGWQATKDSYKQRYATRELMGNLSFSAIETTPLGESSALMLGRWRLNRSAGDVGGNFSLVWRRIEGRWLIVHDHTSSTKSVPIDEPAAVSEALDRAQGNRGQLELALRGVGGEQLEAMQFLIAQMPDRDLRTLTADFLLENVRVAFIARDRAPWKSKIPQEIFFNDLLPYCNINESRDRWRLEFFEQFRPLIDEAKTPTEAAALLNQKIFPLLKVKYSTARNRADQGPHESIKTGLASCTGLSVLLIDACRAVGIPARFVGTPSWTNVNGNHSWVEVWDDGWHFTGAAEPTGDKLDQSWFTDRTALARRDDPKHAIYAVSFQKRPLRFPLVWDSAIDYVNAVNVTDSYTRRGEKLAEGELRVYFQALDGRQRKRIKAALKITESSGKVVFEGTTNDDGFDANDHRRVVLQQGRNYEVQIEFGGRSVSRPVTPDRADELITIELTAVEPERGSGAPGEPRQPTSAVLRELEQWLLLDFDKRPALAEQGFAQTPLSRVEAEQAEKLLWQHHVARIRRTHADEFAARVVTAGDLKMPFFFKTFGEKPARGRSLYISMHGGGGAPPAVNDQQWENQKRLYELEEGVYLAPRAPTNTWDLWHQDHIDRMFSRLIEDLIVFEDVDPDRVYLMGYSAGGDGVYQLAPRMADRFAAVAMMAGHPNETSPLGLRNLPFTLHMGGKDGAYNRNQTALDWEQKLDELQKGDPQGYNHWVKIYPDKGHWLDRMDAAAIPWMAKFRRDGLPKKIVWKQDDVVHDRFYWMAASPKSMRERAEVVAERDGQFVQIQTNAADRLTILASDRIFDLDQPVTVQWGSDKRFSGKVTRTIAILARTLNERGDPQGIFSGEITVEAP